MQNGTNMGFTRGTVSCIRGDRYSDSLIYESYPELVVNTSVAQRDQKRHRPTYYELPRYGTYSEIHTSRHRPLQKGIHGILSLWRPYSSYLYREFVPSEIENQYQVCDRSAIIGMSDLSPLIQNKIREEIVSGKAQFAVDLAELHKTKAMFAAALGDLWHAYRDLRAGRPFASFVREMRRTGFRSTLGNRWLEYVYGWSPTVAGLFDTADVLAKSFSTGLVVTGRVRAKLERRQSAANVYGVEDRYCVARAKGHYQFTIQDPKLFQLSQLGFTNPLSIAWELLPWSFVLDWVVDVGGYINRMDYALGISDIWWQYSCRRVSYNHVTYTGTPLAISLNAQPCIGIATKVSNLRTAPSGLIQNSFKGLKPFTNEKVRLTSALALFDQQRQRINRLR